MRPIAIVATLLSCALIAESSAVFPFLKRKSKGNMEISLTPAETKKIGRKIWQNECSGTVAGLTSWNRGEDFASLGIGHFIWYPPGMEGPFDESWPKLVDYMKQRGVAILPWLLTTPDCPWTSYEGFQGAQNSPEMAQLRDFLAKTVEIQTGFIVQRLQTALPKMKAGAAASPAEAKRLEQQFYAVAQSGQGVYALIDYVNFKGEGVKEAERYRGQGWGLAQVLLEMRGKPQGSAAAAEFSEAAKRVLLRRIRNAPRDETQWQKGWMNRCETYKIPL